MREPTVWHTGFLAGIQGEFVFGSTTRPPKALRWRAGDGIERPAELLAYHPKLRLAVARGPIVPRIVPLVPARPVRLTPDEWVVTLRYNTAGQPVHHAGAVSRRRNKMGSVVEVPGQVGAPILDLEGHLLGVVYSGNRRKAFVVSIDVVSPFLKKAVLGDGGG